MVKGLTFTAIFEAQSLNYDEGFGNLSVLKKLRRGNGEVFTVASRQSLRYSMFTQGVRQFGWKPSSVELSGKGDEKVTQHLSDITQSEEVDLFGYMKTGVPIKNEQGAVVEGKTVTITRRMPVRVMPAISVEPFSNDVEMLTNKYQSDKIKAQPNIANMEQHRSLYRYTVTIDLDRIGNEEDPIGTHISPNTGIKADDDLFKQAERELRRITVKPEIRCHRIQQFLEVVKTFHRLIRGRDESLSPLFIIGGVYDCLNPFFMNAVHVEYQNSKPRVLPEPLKQILNSKYAFGTDLTEQVVGDSTYTGIRDGYFANTSTDINTRVLSPEEMIDELKQQVCASFGEHEHGRATDNANS
ncbi:MAG TPA: type I-B CRISPR-associated protein Cas7/Cst2/DevR [Pyrinomonadaceae bacterium]|jgi:CRISPR-associated protein Cst2